MPSLGGPELLIILVIVMMVFGAGKLTDIGKSLGQGIKEFRKASAEEPEGPAIAMPTCSQCHGMLGPNDRFCATCGAQVAQEPLGAAPVNRAG
jgi:sec-independent protein translocase protein TatA